MSGWGRRLFVLLWAVALAGCSSVRPWVNAPLKPDRAAPQGLVQSDRDPTILVAVTLSGGGARAAAFGYGVLRELQKVQYPWNGKPSNLLDATDIVSGVSGGSIVAAYYAAFGAEGLPRFEPDFLRQNFQNSLITQALHPGNLSDQGSPWFGRSHLLARRLDELFQGMTYGDIERRPRHPQLLITATDMSLGAEFEFTADQFELICSDFASVPLSFAVAASSSVPLLLSPMTLRNYAADCQRDGITPHLREITGTDYRSRLYRAQEHSYLDARTRPYIHLLDGGLVDNLGVRRLLDRAMAGGGLRSSFSEVGIPSGSIRRLVLITVNSERDPSTNINLSDKVPGTLEVVDALLFGAGARATTETQEFLADLTRQWRAEIQSGKGRRGADAFAKDAEIHVIQVNLRDAPESAGRRQLLQIPTALSISGDEVDNLIEAGGHILRNSPEFKLLRESLGAEVR